MIVADQISKRFGNTQAVQSISFEVKESETLVLLGTSGCGKTTTLRMINRLIEPSSGNIWINGKSIFSQPPELLRRTIGYVLQNHGLFPHFTVAENIAIVPKLLKWDSKKILRRTKELIAKLQLPENCLSAYPDELSGGQQQRVGLARGLAADPPILLMDEPFGALDPITRIHIRKELSKLDELKSKTVILVTHDIQEAFELGDRICLMDKGSIIQMGTATELLFKPKNNFVQHFFDHQRFQLELKSVRIEKIWPLLKEVTENKSDKIGITIQGNQSLWNALDILLQQGAGDSSLIVISEKFKEVKSLNSSEVLMAFNQIKNEL
ncbi:MAG: ATP-binding cassette domain-containing protein [Flavisolibacter sp.]|nr:ATP-binding cassette domain-containing protein [Flavisolibacter sp.]